MKCFVSMLEIFVGQALLQLVSEEGAGICISINPCAEYDTTASKFQKTAASDGCGCKIYQQ
jgi:hypothetical protein